MANPGTANAKQLPYELLDGIAYVRVTSRSLLNFSISTWADLCGALERHHPFGAYGSHDLERGERQ